MQKTRYADLEGWVGIVINTLLFVLKQWAGVVSGSVAIIADGWHTLSDAITSAIVVAAARYGRRPADSDHPYGHGRAETLAAFVIGILLALVGLGFIREGVSRFFSPKQAHYGTLAVVVTAVSIVVKELLAQFAFWAARRSGNESVKADGWHHRSDAISSVIVLSGIILGRDIPWIDALLAVIVALLILYAAWEILRDAANALLGESPGEELLNEIRPLVTAILGHDAGLHHLHLHRYGGHVEITFHIRLPQSLTLAEGHRIASSIETAIRTKNGIEATVHIEPVSVPVQADPAGPNLS